jgi:hypothetical protein
LAKSKGSTEVQVARSVLEWAKAEMPEVWWVKGKQIGSFIPILTHSSKRYQLIAVWTNGYMEFQFQHMKAHDSLDDEQRLALLRRVNQTVGTTCLEEAIHRRPSFSLARLARPDRLEEFLKDLEWALDEIKRG